MEVRRFFSVKCPDSFKFLIKIQTVFPTFPWGNVSTTLSSVSYLVIKLQFVLTNKGVKHSTNAKTITHKPLIVAYKRKIIEVNHKIEASVISFSHGFAQNDYMALNTCTYPFTKRTQDREILRKFATILWLCRYLQRDKKGFFETQFYCISFYWLSPHFFHELWDYFIRIYVYILMIKQLYYYIRTFSMCISGNWVPNSLSYNTTAFGRKINPSKKIWVVYLHPCEVPASFCNI